MSYLAIKNLHVAAVALSVAGFVLRFVLSLQGDAWRRRTLLRVGPHVIDTILLASALWLSATLRQYPFVHGWLTAKVAALLVYIFAGSIALRYGRTRRVRTAAFCIALAAVLYIVGAATQKSAWSWF